MARFGMLINTKKCISCYACRVACQRQNELEPTEAFIHFEAAENGTYPQVSLENLPIQCMHCEDAPCQAVCPTGATYTTPDGIVLVDPNRCIGCKYCMAACPYQARVVNEKTGTVDKCRFCAILADQGKKPSSCVAVCPTGARLFGDLDDPESDVARGIAEYNAVPLAGDLTQAKIFYVR